MQPGDFVGLEAGGTGAATAEGARVQLSVKETLQSNRVYYVSGAKGSDSNDGSGPEAGKAFRTIQKAIDVVSSLDTGDFQAIIGVEGNFTYDGFVLKRTAGKNPPRIIGYHLNEANVNISVSTGWPCVRGVDAGHWELGSLNLEQNFAESDCLSIEGDTFVKLVGLMSVSNNTNDSFVCLDGAKLSVEHDIVFKSVLNYKTLFKAKGFGSHIQFTKYGQRNVISLANAMQILDPVFVATEGGSIDLGISTWPNKHTFTGTTYGITRGSHILYSANKTDLPGEGTGFIDSTSSFNDPSATKTVILDSVFYVYVRTDGNDYNQGDGNSPTRAFKTVAAALDKIKKLDLNYSTDIVIYIAAGVYPPVVVPDDFPYKITIQGAAYTSVYFESTLNIPLLDVGKNNRVQLRTIHVSGRTASNGSPLQSVGIKVGARSHLIIQQVAFTGTEVQIMGHDHSLVEYKGQGSVLYPGLTFCHLILKNGSVAKISDGASFLYLGSVQYGIAFVLCELGSVFEVLPGAKFLNISHATGRRFIVRSNSVINVLISGGTNSLPGTLLGTSTTGGIAIAESYN